MKALIIEDAEYKIQSIQSLLKECSYITEVQVARSFQTGIQQIKKERPAVILLDMTLPTSERPSGELEGRTRIYGGRDILAEMDFENIQAKVIVVTQFDQFGQPPNRLTLDALLEQLSSMFPNLYAGGVYYSNVDALWRDKLKRLLDHIGQ